MALLRLVSAAFAAFFFAVLVPAGAGAEDFVGEAGRLVAFRSVGDASDEWDLLRGEIHLQVGTQLQAYRWGRAFCPGKDLTEAQEARLQRALGDRRLVVIPYYKNGQGGSRCLVHFVITERRLADSIPLP